MSRWSRGLGKIHLVGVMHAPGQLVLERYDAVAQEEGLFDIVSNEE